MEIGRTSPRNIALALLYRRSPELQKYLCEYFIVVVDLCGHIMKFAQSSNVRKITMSLNDAELKTFQSDLRQWSALIKEEVHLHLVNQVELEAKENSRFRIMSRKTIATISSERHLTAHLRILDRCSRYDYETTWKQLRKQGNTKLFSQSASYHDWKNKSGSDTLIYYGRLGCGKSVMMANLVENLVSLEKGCDNIVAYFFCQHDIPEGLKAQTVIAALTRQLLHPWSKVEQMNELIGSETSSSRLLEMLWEQLPNTHRVYILLDGPDLCTTADSEQIISWAQKLQTQHSVSLCLTSRHEACTRPSYATYTPGHIGAVPVPDNTADIDSYIDSELERCLLDGSLPISDPSILPSLRDALSSGAHGMFLWVALQIKVLCAMQTDRELREAPRNLPCDLKETYERILREERASGKHLRPEYQKCIFALTVAAWRPLTLSELREALSVTPGDVTWDRSQLINNIYSTLGCCGCLIVIDEEELTVRLVHPSVETYLLEMYAGPDGSRFAVSRAHNIMANQIVTYLSFAAFQGELSRSRIPEMNIGPAPSRIIASTLGATSQATRALGLKFLKAGTAPTLDVRKTLAEALQSHRHTLNHEYHFYTYARAHSVLHLAHILQPGQHIAQLLPNLLTRNIITDQEHTNGFDPLSVLAQHNNVTMFKILYIRRQDGHIVQSERLNETIRLAIIQNDATCIQLLIDSGYITYNFTLDLGRYQETVRVDTPLSHAVAQNSLRVAQALLRTSNMTGEMFTSAIKNGYDDMAELLFENRSNAGFFNLNHGDLTLRPMWLAVTANRPRIVEMLILTRKIRLTLGEEISIRSHIISSCVALLFDAGIQYWDHS